MDKLSQYEELRRVEVVLDGVEARTDLLAACED